MLRSNLCASLLRGKAAGADVPVTSTHLVSDFFTAVVNRGRQALEKHRIFELAQ